MISQNRLNTLPVPEINEQILNHSSKLLQRKDDSFQNKRPPKLRPRNYDLSSNRGSSFSQALSISFQDTTCTEDEILSTSVYNKSINQSYFEQCFVIISKIGEGSFGEVFKVRSKEDGHLYAVKQSKQFFRSGTYRDERLQEVKRYEQFSDHNHCVTLYKAWEQGDRLYMQMELCEGSLEDYLLKQKYLPEWKIWSILCDLLTALKSFHDRNLIHLDIKLDNILVGDDGRCKLADFGLVVDVHRANLHQATEGDSRYIAPEIMMGKFSMAADIFSLGIAILELSCNLALPSNGPLWQKLRNGILPEDFINPISIELQKVIQRMMNPNSLLRPTATEILRHRKLIEIQNKRNRRKLFGKIKRSVRNTKKFIWAKLCTFKMFICRLFVNIVKFFETKKPIFDQSRSSIDNETEFSPLKVSSDENFPNNSKFYNSTPLCHNSLNIRSRKDLSKTNIFRYNVNEHSPTFESFDTTNQSTKSSQVSESIAKKLFL